jgi:hypothetical protein
MPRLLLSIVEGRLIRDLFENGLLDSLSSANIDVTVATPATNNAEYVAKWRRRGVELIEWQPSERSVWQMRSWYWRKSAGRKLGRLGERSVHWIEKKTTLRPNPADLRLLEKIKPDFYLATHTHKFDEQPLISAARSCGLETLGLVRSWDNVHYGLRTRPDGLSVWNEVNRQEVIEIEHFDPDRVHITGPAQFDPYFDEAGILDRSEFCKTLNLDPARPILTYATIGQYSPTYDETYLADLLLDLINRGEVSRDTQLVIRLHPWSHYEQFYRFSKDPRVRISFVDRYVPGLTWMMNRDEVIWLGNLLRHSSVVVTPGSTITLETAIFDTPTLVPTFHTSLPEVGKRYFGLIMGKHFKYIRSKGLVAIDDNVDDFISNLKTAFADPAWFREQRKELRDTYIPFQDGKCTERLSRLIISRIHGTEQIVVPAQSPTPVPGTVNNHA